MKTFLSFSAITFGVVGFTGFLFSVVGAAAFQQWYGLSAIGFACLVAFGDFLIRVSERLP